MMRDARAYGKSDYQGFNCGSVSVLISLRFQLDLDSATHLILGQPCQLPL